MWYGVGMKKGKLIVIDGIDGVGKATQAKLLVGRLNKEGKKAVYIDFPQYYKNHFGKLIGECQAGEHGDFLNLDPKIASTLYAADRFESKEQIGKWLSSGYIVVADRYASGNQIHQGGKIRNPKKQKAFLKWLDSMEFGVFKIPRPDVIIYLSLPVRLSLKLLKKAKKDDTKKRYLKGKKDVVESSLRYLEESRKSALSIIRGSNNWKEVVCNRGNEILPKEAIHELLWREARKVLT